MMQTVLLLVALLSCPGAQGQGGRRVEDLGRRPPVTSCHCCRGGVAEAGGGGGGGGARGGGLPRHLTKERQEV